MKRQKDTTIASRVFVYGAVPARIAPVDNEEAALEQMRLANRLWNVLVAIERARVARYRTIMRNATQERIDELRRQAAALRDEIKLRRATARKRTVDIADLTGPLEAIKAELPGLIEEQKATAKERQDAKRAELTALQERTAHRVKRARQAAGNLGLFWGTYNEIVQRGDSARKHGGEMHFRGFRGEGTLTAQIMGGAMVERCVESAHTFFQVDPPTQGQRWRYARMRIGSNADRSPIWLEVPIVYHRDLPVHGTIKSVSMTRRLLAGKVQWQLNVTFNTAAPPPKQTGAAVAVDIGWRLMPEGVRVAYWLDEAGRHGQVLIPASDIDQFEKVKSLRSICDRWRDEFLPLLTAWLAGAVLPPEWERESAHLSQWRSADRLARLVEWWRDHRLPDDEESYEAAVYWRRRHLHLSQWERNLQDQLKLKLREQYRIFAAWVAREYGTVVIESFDLREMAGRPKAEDKGGNTASPGQRQTAGPSVFRGALLNAVKREGRQVVVFEAAYTTRRCHLCAYLGEWDQAPDVLHRCVRCGRQWDQDYNADANLLQAWRAGSGRSAVA